MTSQAHSNSFKPRTAAFMAAFFRQAQVSPTAQPRAPKRRILRTYIYVNGRIHDARIDMHTGEVRQHEYKNRFRRSPRVSLNTKSQQLEPFWVQSVDPMPTASSTELKPDEKDVSRIKMANSAKEQLHLYICLRDAVEDFPQLDDIICGATALDLGGNTRGLNRAHIFTLLQQLDVISAFQVRKFAGHSKSHSEKVAVCLRIIVRAFVASIQMSTIPSLT